MGKQVFKKQKGHTILINKLGKYERLNAEELRILTNRSVKGLAPIGFINKRFRMAVGVDVTALTPITQYFSQSMKVESVVAILWSTIRIARACECYGLCVDHLNWNPETIFLDRDGKITMIYWPVTTLDNATYSAFQFYCTYATVLHNCGLDRQAYNRFCSYFQERTSLDIGTLYHIVEELNRECHANNKPKTDDVELKSEQIAREKNVLRFSVAWLENKQTKEQIALVKDRIIFGRASCDVNLSAFAEVSRQHALLFKKHNDYYIADLGSVNGTYLNGVRVPPNARVKLKDGDVLQISCVSWAFHNTHPNQTLSIHQAKTR